MNACHHWRLSKCSNIQGWASASGNPTSRQSGIAPHPSQQTTYLTGGCVFISLCAEEIFLTFILFFSRGAKENELWLHLVPLSQVNSTAPSVMHLPGFIVPSRADWLSSIVALASGCYGHPEPGTDPPPWSGLALNDIIIAHQAGLLLLWVSLCIPLSAEQWGLQEPM